MKRLQDRRGDKNRGAHIEDAEFVDVSDTHDRRAGYHQQGSRPPTLSDWWEHKSAIFKLCVAVPPVLLLAMCFADPPPASDQDQANFSTEAAQPSSNAVEPIADLPETFPPEPPAPPSVVRDVATSEWLVGSWVAAVRGGKDGGTACSDYIAPALPRAMSNTGTVVTFEPSGIYRETFAYTTPSNDEHRMRITARWELRGAVLRLTDATIIDAFVVHEDAPEDQQLTRMGENVLELGSKGGTQRLVRCQGDVSEIHGE